VLFVPDMRGMVPPAFTSVRLEAYTVKASASRASSRNSSRASSSTRRITSNGMSTSIGMRDFATLTHLAEWNRYWLGNYEQDD